MRDTTNHSTKTPVILNDLAAIQLHTIAHLGTQATAADYRHGTLLSTQVALGRQAPTLTGRMASPEQRITACADRALWLASSGIGWTQQAIADHLNDEGQTSMSGRPWTQSLVSGLLRRSGGTQ